MQDSIRPIRILIVDDHPLFRAWVADRLTREPDFVVVGQAGSGEEAFDLVAETMPDILLLDVSMPGQGGIETAQQVSAAYPLARIIMLTMSEDQADLMNALKAGAWGYVLKGVVAHELAQAVRVVATSEVYISPALIGYFLFEMTGNRPADPLDELSEPEREILRLVAKGLTNREIGERLHLAENTIRHYMTSLLQKLRRRSQIAPRRSHPSSLVKPSAPLPRP